MFTPDVEGWYCFKPKGEREFNIVLVDFDGRVFTLNEYGSSVMIQETIGDWKTLEEFYGE